MPKARRKLESDLSRSRVPSLRNADTPAASRHQVPAPTCKSHLPVILRPFSDDSVVVNFPYRNSVSSSQGCRIPDEQGHYAENARVPVMTSWFARVRGVLPLGEAQGPSPNEGNQSTARAASTMASWNSHRKPKVAEPFSRDFIPTRSEALRRIQSGSTVADTPDLIGRNRSPTDEVSVNGNTDTIATSSETTRPVIPLVMGGTSPEATRSIPQRFPAKHSWISSDVEVANPKMANSVTKVGKCQTRNSYWKLSEEPSLDCQAPAPVLLNQYPGGAACPDIPDNRFPLSISNALVDANSDDATGSPRRVEALRREPSAVVTPTEAFPMRCSSLMGVTATTSATSRWSTNRDGPEFGPRPTSYTGALVRNPRTSGSIVSWRRHSGYDRRASGVPSRKGVQSRRSQLGVGKTFRFFRQKTAATINSNLKRPARRRASSMLFRGKHIDGDADLDTDESESASHKQKWHNDESDESWSCGDPAPGGSRYSGLSMPSRNSAPALGVLTQGRMAWDGPGPALVGRASIGGTSGIGIGYHSRLRREHNYPSRRTIAFADGDCDIDYLSVPSERFGSQGSSKVFGRQRSNSSSVSSVFIRAVENPEKPPIWMYIMKVAGSLADLGRACLRMCGILSPETRQSAPEDPTLLPRYLRREINRALRDEVGPYRRFSQRVPLSALLQCTREYWIAHPEF